MNNNTKNELINLAKSIFEDKEFIQFEKSLNRNIKSLRLFLSEKFDYYETIYLFRKDDEVLKKQIEFLDKMQDLVIAEIEINA